MWYNIGGRKWENRVVLLIDGRNIIVHFKGDFLNEYSNGRVREDRFDDIGEPC